MVFRMALTYSEIEYILDVKYIATTSIAYTLPPEIHETGDFALMLLPLLPEEA